MKEIIAGMTNAELFVTFLFTFAALILGLAVGSAVTAFRAWKRRKAEDNHEDATVEALKGYDLESLADNVQEKQIRIPKTLKPVIKAIHEAAEEIDGEEALEDFRSRLEELLH